MKPAPFEYHVPADVEEAVALLADLGDQATAIAGGQSLVPMLALRLARFEHLVDLRRLEESRGIEHRGESVWIGAGTTQAAIQRSDEVRRALPLLAGATPLIGYFQIRNRGTIGGSIAHADAKAEYPAVALTLEADIETASPRGHHTIPAAQFFTGPWNTALAHDELITGITFPVWHGQCGFAVEEFTRKSRDFAIAGATVAIGLGDDGRIDRCRIGLFALAPVACRAVELEKALIGAEPAEAVADDIGRSATSGLDSVPSDLHGPADYRKRIGAVMVARAWRRALQEALHG